MLKSVRKFAATGIALLVTLSGFAGLTQPVAATTTPPLKFSMTYSDNATLPFKEDWLSVVEIQKALNLDIEFEVIPNTDYLQKTTLMLNAGTATDVVMYTSVRTGDMAAFALNGVFFPISEHPDLTPNFNAKVEEFGLEEIIEGLRLLDGVRYYIPALFDKPFYDGGVIIREDFLVNNNLEAPTTYYEYYEVLKAYKEQFPESYPLTNLVDSRVTYRMTMPSFGISVGQNAAAGSFLSISYDYEKKNFLLPVSMKSTEST